MSETEPEVPWHRNGRIAVPVGILALVGSFGLVIPAPVVVPVVLGWWLHIDTTRSDQRRPGWLGAFALVVYALAASVVVVIVISFDSHFDCGGTLGGPGESASARLDEGCLSNRWWRPIVGAVVMVAATIAAGVRLWRLPNRRGGGPVERAAAARRRTLPAVTTMAGLTVCMVVVIAALVAS